ncbi:MAG: L,D-transpeptidase [Methylovirgula sp.]
MRGILGTLLLLCGSFWLAPASATVRIQVDLTSQTKHVESSTGSYFWPVSTARAGYVTPRGTFRPYSLQAVHYSRKYYDSPMPHSIFFDGGFAIHGTYETAWLGHPVSHGCVRIAPENAALLFQMVKAEGAVITISGTPPTQFYAGSQERRQPGVGYARARYYYDSPGPGWLFDPFGQ